MSNSLRFRRLQHSKLHCPSLSPRVCSNSCSLSWWCHPTISSYVDPFSSCPQSFPASESFPMSQLFPSGGQSIESSASVSVLPMNVQGWFSSGLTGLISGTNHILRAPPPWSNYFAIALPPTNIILRVKISEFLLGRTHSVHSS